MDNNLLNHQLRLQFKTEFEREIYTEVNREEGRNAGMLPVKSLWLRFLHITNKRKQIIEIRVIVTRSSATIQNPKGASNIQDF